MGYSLWSHKESDTTEQLTHTDTHTHTHTHHIADFVGGDSSTLYSRMQHKSPGV